MPANTPEELHRLWAEAYNAGDLEALIELYEAEAVLVPQPGQPPVVGREAIRRALKGFLARKGELKIAIATAFALRGGEVALLRSRWTLEGRGHDGQDVALTHQSAEVARRQADGSWRYLIDNPFGGD
jgi:uncharacterized protein (TIGR02246 family)